MSQIFNRRDQMAKRQVLRDEMPAAERRLWSQLRGKACSVKFRRQVSVGAYVLDFYCPQLRLALEIDGPTHESDEAVACDAARQQQTEALAVRFLRFSNEQVYHHLPEVMETILQTIAQLQQVECCDTENPLCPSDISPSTRGRD